MLTGDNEKTAKYVSDELGLDGYISGVLPHEKQEKIKSAFNINIYVTIDEKQLK
jgi:cation transport ATPase